MEHVGDILAAYVDRLVRTDNDDYVRLHPRWAVRILQTISILENVENEWLFDRLLHTTALNNGTLAPRALLGLV